MPEQLTKHPEVTLQVLRSAGVRCGSEVEGAAQILRACPPERLCKLPGGELCVRGLPEAGRLIQIGPAELRAALGVPPPADAGAAGDAAASALMLALLLGAAIGGGAVALWARRAARRRR